MTLRRELEWIDGVCAWLYLGFFFLLLFRVNDESNNLYLI